MQINMKDLAVLLFEIIDGLSQNLVIGLIVFFNTVLNFLSGEFAGVEVDSRLNKSTNETYSKVRSSIGISGIWPLIFQ